MTAHGGRFLQCNEASGGVRIGERRLSVKQETTLFKVNGGASQMRLYGVNIQAHGHTHTHSHTHTATTTNVMAQKYGFTSPQ